MWRQIGDPVHLSLILCAFGVHYILKWHYISICNIFDLGLFGRSPLDEYVPKSPFFIPKMNKQRGRTPEKMGELLKCGFENPTRECSLLFVPIIRHIRTWKKKSSNCSNYSDGSNSSSYSNGSNPIPQILGFLQLLQMIRLLRCVWRRKLLSEDIFISGCEPQYTQ